MSSPDFLSVAVLVWWLAVGVAMAAAGCLYLQRLFFMDPDPSEYVKYTGLAGLCLVAIISGIVLCLDTGERLIAFINSL